MLSIYETTFNQGDMDKLFISNKVRQKLLEKHEGITQKDIEECFANRDGSFLVDTREDHKTDPQTLWFIAENHYGKLIEVVFIPMLNGQLSVKSAFKPNATEIDIYQRKAYNIPRN